MVGRGLQSWIGSSTVSNTCREREMGFLLLKPLFPFFILHLSTLVLFYLYIYIADSDRLCQMEPSRVDSVQYLRCAVCGRQLFMSAYERSDTNKRNKIMTFGPLVLIFAKCDLIHVFFFKSNLWTILIVPCMACARETFHISSANVSEVQIELISINFI